MELNTATTKPEYTRIPLCESPENCMRKQIGAGKTGGLTESKYGIGVPAGEVAKTPEEAESIAKRIGMPQYCLT